MERMALENKIRELRRILHENPEPSGREEGTKALLMRFIKRNTLLEVEDFDGGFYALQKTKKEEQPGIVFRAACCAVRTAEDRAEHRFGNDGHAAALCALGLLAGRETFGRDVYYLFETGSDSGRGGRACAQALKGKNISEIYAVRNIPGLERGRIALRQGSFCCGKRNLVVRFSGSPADLAYPETGKNPAEALGFLLEGLPGLCATGQHAFVNQYSVAGVKAGKPGFRAAADTAEVWISLRSERTADLERIAGKISERAGGLGFRFGLTVRCDTETDFPAVENTVELMPRLQKLGAYSLLKTPMRWDDDFGWLLKNFRGAMLGIGAGTETPALGTADYQYPDALLLPTAELCKRLIGQTL